MFDRKRSILMGLQHTPCVSNLAAIAASAGVAYSFGEGNGRGVEHIGDVERVETAWAGHKGQREVVRLLAAAAPQLKKHRVSESAGRHQGPQPTAGALLEDGFEQ